MPHRKGRRAGEHRTDTALAWLDRYYLEATVALVKEQAEEAELEIEAADCAYRAGRGARPTCSPPAPRGGAAEKTTEPPRMTTAVTMLARWVGPGADAPLAGAPELTALPLTARTSRRTRRPSANRHAQRRSSVAAADVQVAQANSSPTGASKSPISNAAPATATCFRSASAFRCSGTTQTARTARSPRSSRSSTGARAARGGAARPRGRSRCDAQGMGQRPRTQRRATPTRCAAGAGTHAAAVAAYRGGKGDHAACWGRAATKSKFAARH